jgi:hypothetical protein
MALADVMRRVARLKKEADSAKVKNRYWVTLIGLYQVQIVYFVAGLKFKNLMHEKKELILGVTKLLSEMQLELYGNNDSISERHAIKSSHSVVDHPYENLVPEALSFDDSPTFMSRSNEALAPPLGTPYRRNNLCKDMK